MTSTVQAREFTDDPAWLLDYCHDYYSQQGEDGVIEKALTLLPERDGWCVEFGAWDGLHLTNTRHLIESGGYRAVLIEASRSKFKELKANYAANPKVTPLCRLVASQGEHSLDRILGDTEIPGNFDFLSIDIDGNDYYVWEGLKDYQPKLVVVEFNPTIPSHVEFVQPNDPSVTQGASVLSLVKLAREKGYELVCVLKWNAVFVRSEYFDRFGISDNSLNALRKYNEMITWLFSGYDGKIFLDGYRRLPWHQIDLHAENFQRLPRYLQKFQDNYSRIERALFRIYLRFIGGKTPGVASG